MFELRRDGGSVKLVLLVAPSTMDEWCLVGQVPRVGIIKGCLEAASFEVALSPLAYDTFWA